MGMLTLLVNEVLKYCMPETILFLLGCEGMAEGTDDTVSEEQRWLA